MIDLRDLCDRRDVRSQCFEWGIVIIILAGERDVDTVDVTGSSSYKDGIRHFLASSSDVAQLVVQPGSTQGLAEIVRTSLPELSLIAFQSVSDHAH